MAFNNPPRFHIEYLNQYFIVFPRYNPPYNLDRKTTSILITQQGYFV